MKPYYQDEKLTIYNGDNRAVLPTLPEKSVHCCVTSPPYFGLRDYGNNAQIGLEKTPDEYVAELVKVFREVRRVLRDDGTLWLNLGDSYNGSGKGVAGVTSKLGGVVSDAQHLDRATRIDGLKPKDLIGIPWRVAFALQADGWYLRQDIIWAKPNPMPESVTDRCTKAHEYIFLLSKSARYYFDNDLIREDVKENSGQNMRAPKLGDHRKDGNYSIVTSKTYDQIKGANRRSVWTVATQPYSGAHFATFPPELIKPCIQAGCPESGVVLDPFAGSGTTLEVAELNGCKAIGIELNASYCKLIKQRVKYKPLAFAE